MEMTHPGSILEEGSTLEQFVRDFILWEGSQTGAGEEHAKKGEAETKCFELVAAPIPHPLRCSGWEEVEGSGMKD